MELAIVKYIKEFGLDKAVADFKLKLKEYPSKIMLKYDQLASQMSFEEVRECRGLILEKGTWRVMCMSFRKFFNSAEGAAATIDWSTARILEKLDGSLIQLYFDWVKNEWIASTTGTGEGEGEVNNKMGTTFNELFFETLGKYDFNIDMLNTKFTYVFELTTPYNIVVKPHGVSSVTLLTARDNTTLNEVCFEDLQSLGSILDIPVVKSFDLNASNVDDLIATLENMPWSEEGYVVVDAQHNRVKIKNPAYVAVHHLKSKMAEHNIVTIVKTNEVDEFIATFPDRAEELLKLKANYDILVAKLDEGWKSIEEFKPTDKDDVAGRKSFAEKVFTKCAELDVKQFSGLYFNLGMGKTDSVREYMLGYDDKILYKLL